MSDVPSELKYTESHEWVRIEGDGSMTVGITDHAQSLLGDLVYVELPEEDSELNAGDESGVLESVKAASDLYSPISGKVVAVNEDLNDNPALINSDPYGAGWIFRMEASDESELNELLDADSYQEHVDAE